MPKLRKLNRLLLQGKFYQKLQIYMNECFYSINSLSFFSIISLKNYFNILLGLSTHYSQLSFKNFLITRLINFTNIVILYLSNISS